VFDVPVDSTYVWFGVGAVSLAVFGVAAGLPSAAPPDAAAAAATVDAVAVGPPGAVDHHELRADRIRLGSFRSDSTVPVVVRTPSSRIRSPPLSRTVGSNGYSPVSERRRCSAPRRSSPTPSRLYRAATRTGDRHRTGSPHVGSPGGV